MCKYPCQTRHALTTGRVLNFSETALQALLYQLGANPCFTRLRTWEGGKACVAAGVPSTSLLRPRAQPGSQRRLLLRPAPPGRYVGGAGPLLMCVLVRSEGLSPGQRPQGADAEGGDDAAPPAGLVDSSGRQMLACHSALREHVSSKSLHLPASQGPDEPRPLLLASLVHSPAVMSLSCPGNRAAP